MTDLTRTDFDSELRRHNDVLTRASDIHFADHVLDIGCGTGQTTRHAAQTAGAGSALGIDVSGPSIEQAHSAASAAGIANVDFEHADAQTYPFTRDHFDVALSRFGTMFFEDPATAFANIRRSLRPGGRLVMMVWQSRHRNEWIVAIDRALNAAETTVTDLSERSNPFSLADPATVTVLLEDAGFTDVAFADVNEPVFYGADSAAALDWIFGFTFVTDMLNRMDPVAREHAVRALEETVAAHTRQDGVWFASRAWIVTARNGLVEQSLPSAHASSSQASDELMVTVDDVDLCVQTFGDPTAPALLLISGAESSMDWWDDEFCGALAAERYVSRYDTRDTGRSTTFTPGKPPYEGNALIEDAVGLLDELGIAAAHLVGISMGGGIAQVLAVHHPERVLSLTLIATSPGGRDLPPMEPRLAEQMGGGGQPDWSDREAVIAYYLGGEHMLAGTIPVDEERMRRIVGRVWDRSPSIASGQNHWQLSGGEPVRDRLAEITAPTLVLHGTADPLFPLGHGRRWLGKSPGRASSRSPAWVTRCRLRNSGAP